MGAPMSICKGHLLFTPNPYIYLYKFLNIVHLLKLKTSAKEQVTAAWMDKGT
jgi:hypothetical protein